MDSKTKVGFIGFGNMGSAICDGLIKAEAVNTSNIFACANNWDKLLKETESRQIKACKNAEELVKNADMIVVAVKGKIIVSIAAGCNADFYEKLLGSEYNYIVTMPNTPISICEGVLLCEDNHKLKAEQLECFMGIFTAVATVEFIESKVFSVAGAMSGCGPAFVAMFIEALGDAGVKYGLKRDVAYRLASKVISGTGELQMATGAHPAAMKDAVCSPGGTTIKGVTSLEENGFRSAVIKAIDAIENK